MQLTKTILKKLSSRKLLIGNTTWLLATEVVARLSRILTLIVLAKMFSASEFGMAMLALAFHDVMRLVLKCGSGSQIVQCDEKTLAVKARNGAALQWCLSGILFICQFFAADVIAAFYQQPAIADTIRTLAYSYLIYPLTAINVFMVQRANKMRFISLVNASCIVIENLAVAVLVLLEFGLISVAYAKIISAFVWTATFYIPKVRNFGIGLDLPVFKSLINTSGKLFSSELCKAARQHADLFLAGKILAPEMFGVYSFAKSAGVGISQSLTNAYNASLYPYACKLHREGTLNQATKFLLGFTSVIASAFIAQALLVPVYVPLIFGAQWQASITCASIMCFAAAINIYFDTYCTAIRATAQFSLELILRVIVTFGSVLLILLSDVSSPEGMAYAVLVAALLGPLSCLAKSVADKLKINSNITIQSEEKL